MKATSILALAMAGVACGDDLAVLRAPATVTFNNDASSMKTTDVADMLSQSLGLPSLSDADTVHARIGSLNAPRASVLFVADGHDMDKDSYSGAVSYRNVEAGDMDSVATVVSAVSGKLPAEHLIPARLWLTSLGFEHAFSYAGTHSAAGNVADMVSQLFDGSVIVSMSADKQFASATSPHPTVAKKGNTYVYYLDESGFQPRYKTMVGLPLKKENLYAAMPEFFSSMFSGAKYCPVAKTATIDGAVFDLKNKADFKFFSEMAAARLMLNNMKSTAADRAQNAHPDFYSFGMSALPSLKLQYGAESKQFKTAQALYTQFFGKMADEFMSAYDNQAVVTLLGLDERADTRTLARRQAAAAEDPYAACTGTEQPDYCAYGPNHAVYFQMFFWITVVLVIATWMAIYAVANMEIKDSVIFRMTAMPRFKTE